MGERLASNGYLVLLPDLFYRAGPYAPVDVATLFSDPEKRAANGWTMKDIPIYNEAAAERHCREMLPLFEQTLKAA